MTNLGVINNLPELLRLIPNHDRIIIVGYPKSGKSTLFHEIKENIKNDCDYTFIQTDDYIEKYPYKEQLYKIIEDLQSSPRQWFIVEGIQSYRLLRKIEEMELFDLKPDLVITCKTNRPMSEKHVNQSKGLDTVWNKYRKIIMDEPDYIVYEN